MTAPARTWPHCTRCGQPAPDGQAAIGADDVSFALLITCLACLPHENEVSEGPQHCIVCGEPTESVGQLEGVLFRGRPIEVLACLLCFDRIVREDPALGWLDGLALETAAAADDPLH